MRGGFAVDTLGGKTAMVDALASAFALQGTVCQIGPPLAQLLDIVSAATFDPSLGPVFVAHFQISFTAELDPVFPAANLPGRGQQMGMVVALIAFLIRAMDCHINGHTVAVG